MASDLYKALIVEDERFMRQHAARTFEGKGFLCDQAANGREALALLSDHRYQVVVTDLCMPEINGHKVALEVLGQTDRPALLVVTGVDDERLVRDLKTRGVDEIHIKPVNYAEVAEHARQLIEHRIPRSHSESAEEKQTRSQAESKLGRVIEQSLNPQSSGEPEEFDTDSSPVTTRADRRNQRLIEEVLHVVNMNEYRVNLRLAELERERTSSTLREQLIWLLLALAIGIGAGMLL